MQPTEGISELLKKIEQAGVLIPPRVEPPEASIALGINDLGELPLELKRLYTAIEICLQKIEASRVRSGRKYYPVIPDSWEERRAEAVEIFQAALKKKYDGSKTIFSCSDWHAYTMPY